MLVHDDSVMPVLYLNLVAQAQPNGISVHPFLKPAILYSPSYSSKEFQSSHLLSMLGEVSWIILLLSFPLFYHFPLWQAIGISPMNDSKTSKMYGPKGLPACTS